jgi:hypothetical protein
MREQKSEILHATRSRPRIAYSRVFSRTIICVLLWLIAPLPQLCGVFNDNVARDVIGFSSAETTRVNTKQKKKKACTMEQRATAHTSAMRRLMMCIVPPLSYRRC